MPTSSSLGPACVGRRVVVRRLVPGETGPSGGPAMSDVLGVLESWSADVAVVRRADGALVEVRLGDIVAGKPVPPPATRGSRRGGVGPVEAERRAARGWPAPEVEPLGEWLLRAADGFSTRANSVLACGTPGTSTAEALTQVTGFYARHRLPALAQVVTGSEEAEQLRSHGWLPARPDEDDTEFRVASLSALGTLLPAPPRAAASEVSRSPRLDDGWLATDDRAGTYPGAAARVLEGPSDVVFATCGSPVVARGRCSVDGDWAGVTDVWVSPERRREGLARRVLADLVGWAVERGATTLYLQVRGDNRPATALYDRLGIDLHHRYHYLRSP